MEMEPLAGRLNRWVRYLGTCHIACVGPVTYVCSKNGRLNTVPAFPPHCNTNTYFRGRRYRQSEFGEVVGLM